MSERAQVAVGLIVADDGRLLLQHRDDKPGLPGAGMWGLFGGRVESGEGIEEAFLREMYEELGWRPKHFEYYVSREIRREGWHVLSHAFAAHLDVPVNELVLGEGQDMALFAPDELPDTIVPDLRLLIATFTASETYRSMARRPS